MRLEDCKQAFGLIQVCKGYHVRIYPRGGRGFISYSGCVEALNDVAIAIKMNETTVLFRWSEIKFIEVVGSECS